MMSTDWTLIKQLKEQLADRYTSAELADLIELPTEAFLDTYMKEVIERMEALTLFDEGPEDEGDSEDV